MGAVLSPERWSEVTSELRNRLVEQKEWEFSPGPLMEESAFSWSGEGVGEAVAPIPGARDALQVLVERWAKIAVSHATVRRTEDPPGMVATVVGVDGAWGFGSTPAEALEDLQSVLVDWANLKLQDGDDDIPNMEGVHLVVER